MGQESLQLDIMDGYQVVSNNGEPTAVEAELAGSVRITWKT